ncbi:N-acetylmuramic acid 6-phosphate etherase [Spiractinospora alimapuensis]|uniref:N-acetylmuramic acid 6-phosphate etherase n=1 Tax=Spiractinospora alimapuensis TaxID=2820884 RepID=UPI001F344EF3|nr:N-acetylmuramic acid 6-phosphate etherase [Spiractinospora alimapuensis]QVQ53992.1 N-acetylmuramic acid 6-phosphate etherase [Spiractinospora alimapuensis]
MTESVPVMHAPTEERNHDTHDIDLLPSLGILQHINTADATVPNAVALVLPQLARVVDAAVERVRHGGRVHYFGAGTSGRLAALDAAEVPPTFGVPPDLFVAHHAGGPRALSQSVKEAEDDDRLGASDAACVHAQDVAIGVTASGTTRYVGGALRECRRVGAVTALISANPGSPLAHQVDVHVGVDTGAEVIAGSTRMKAGTAQKLLLNAFSTATLVRLGCTFSNLMVGVDAGNAKLRGRMVGLLAQATGYTEDTCAETLAETGGNTRVALVSMLAGVPVESAVIALRDAGGSVRGALESLGTGPTTPTHVPDATYP